MDITETLNRNFFCILLRTLLHPVNNSHKRQFHWLFVSPPVSPQPVEGIFFSYDSEVFVYCHLQMKFTNPLFFLSFHSLLLPFLSLCNWKLYTIISKYGLFKNKFNVNLECNSYTFSFFPPTRGSESPNLRSNQFWHKISRVAFRKLYKFSKLLGSPLKGLGMCSPGSFPPTCWWEMVANEV